jgi:hypothetical protein
MLQSLQTKTKITKTIKSNQHIKLIRVSFVAWGYLQELLWGHDCCSPGGEGGEQGRRGRGLLRASGEEQGGLAPRAPGVARLQRGQLAGKQRAVREGKQRTARQTGTSKTRQNRRNDKRNNTVKRRNNSTLFKQLRMIANSANKTIKSKTHSNIFKSNTTTCFVFVFTCEAA